MTAYPNAPPPMEQYASGAVDMPSGLARANPPSPANTDMDTAGWDAIVEHWLETDGGKPNRKSGAELEIMLTGEGAPDLPFRLKDGESAKRSRQTAIGRQFSKAATANAHIADARNELWRIRKERGEDRTYYALEAVSERIDTDMPAGKYRNAAWWAQRWGVSVLEAGKRLAAMVESGRMLERTAQGRLVREYALANE